MHFDKKSWLTQLDKEETQCYQPGEIICYPERAANDFFILQSGQARVYLSTDAKELTISNLRPNNLYVTHTRAWIEAMTEVKLTRWPLSQLKTLITLQPEYALAAMQEIGVMLHNSIDIIEDLAFRSVESRFARYLLTEYYQQNQTTIELMGNTEILASLLGTSRQTLSTLINRMLREGVLQRIDRKHVSLLKIADLEKLVAGMSAS